MSCKHLNTHAHIEVVHLEERPGQGTASIQIHCVDCSRRLVFDGLPWGYSPSRPMVSPFGDEARLPFHMANDEEQAAFEKMAGKLA
jgi:hypothetical protein